MSKTMSTFADFEDSKRHGTFDREIEKIAAHAAAERRKDENRQKRDAFRAVENGDKERVSYHRAYRSLVKGIIEDPDPCVYVIETEGGKPYIGQTANIELRIIEHIFDSRSSLTTGSDPA